MPKFLPPEELVAFKKSTHLRECFLAVEASIFHNPDLLCPETEHSTNFKKKKKASNKLSQSFFFFFATLYGSFANTLPYLFLNLFYRLITDFSGPHSAWFIPPSSLQLAVVDHTSLLPKTPTVIFRPKSFALMNTVLSKWFLPFLVSTPPQSHIPCPPVTAPQGYLYPPVHH